MIVVYVLAGAIAGFVCFGGAIIFGYSFWIAMLVYFVVGSALMLFAALSLLLAEADSPNLEGRHDKPVPDPLNTSDKVVA